MMHSLLSYPYPGDTKSRVQLRVVFLWHYQLFTYMTVSKYHLFHKFLKWQYLNASQCFGTRLVLSSKNKIIIMYDLVSRLTSQYWDTTHNKAGTMLYFLKMNLRRMILSVIVSIDHYFGTLCILSPRVHNLVLLKGGGPRVVVSTAAFHARVRGSVPGLGGLKETKLFLPHPRVKVSIVGSLRDREVACSASDRQGSNFESCVWRTVSSQSSHHPQEVLLAQFSLYVHKGGLKPDSFHFGASKICISL